MQPSHYYDPSSISKLASEGDHRQVIGGLWQEIGRLQFEFLKSQGLRPDNTLLDIGCGSLRGGVHFIQYLESGNYYGIDVNQSLLDAGYEIELAEVGIQDRLPRQHLACVGNFDFSVFERTFDFALAQSVFTHLPFNHIRQCLEQLSTVMVSGGIFFATFFELPGDRLTTIDITHQPGGIVTHGSNDPYHYRINDFEYACIGLPWRVHYIGNWDHPRSQKMIAFINTK